VTKKPVYPTRRCSGRTARPSTCQPRTRIVFSMSDDTPQPRVQKIESISSQNAMNNHHRYCPVFATVSIERPDSVPVLPETRVLM
jgi:hypothetical protein